MPKRDTHWTDDFPLHAATAGRLLGLLPGEVATHSHADVPAGLFHVWTPGRGGLQLVMGLDRSVYVRESCFTAAQMRAFHEHGRRTDLATLAERPLNHAASAVAAMIRFVRGGERATAEPTGPSQAELEDLVGSPLRPTTPEEIAARLTDADDPTAHLLVGVDREQGPGHWYVAMRMDGEVTALDPIANTRHPWPPPNADAVRWWASGTPTQPAQPVPAAQPAAQEDTVLCEADAHGTRVWLRTTPLLAPFGQQLVDAWARQPADRIASGRGIWFGFWWTALSTSNQGDGLRVAASDLGRVEDATSWNVDAALEVMRQQVEMVSFCRAQRDSINFLRTVAVEPGALEAPEVHLLRRQPGEHPDSGWYVGTSPTPSADVEVLPAKEVWRRRPELTRYLGLPVGFRAVWSGKRTAFLRNPAGNLIWDAAEHDRRQAATAASATGSTTGSAPTTAAAGSSRPRRTVPRGGSPTYARAVHALYGEHTSPADLLAAAREVRGCFERSEHLVGMLPAEAPDVLVELWERAGTGEALVDLGDWWRAPLTGSRDPARAIAAYQRADAAGARAGALGWVREMYFTDLGDPQHAVTRLEQLVADDGDGRAHVLRGWMRFKGWGYPRDPAAAAADHRTAAGRGNADAHFELSVLHGTGQGVERDPRLALDHLEQAAAQDHPRALHNLAAMFATGRGVPTDAARAVELYERAADRGHAQAAFTAGVMLLTGEGAGPDEGRARDLLGLAEHHGLDVRERAGALPPALRDRILAVLAR
ncbi:tetratricopeptide repeat protein [Nocardioides sp. CPCC 205120]|uniref:tetratricopeptide repeat protein n=1 Tax=Nocardioides sp. CPCC 205120 TaxID=3406462 RepID=UPI003B50CB1A